MTLGVALCMIFFHSDCSAIKPKKITCGTVENNFYKSTRYYLQEDWTFENDMLACFETLSPYIVQAGLYVLNSGNSPISVSQVEGGYRHT